MLPRVFAVSFLKVRNGSKEKLPLSFLETFRKLSCRIDSALRMNKASSMLPREFALLISCIFTSKIYFAFFRVL